MSNSLTKPDLEFIRQLKAAGGENVKKCFQCATCSVVCKLSPDERPYPRKEMIWAQWGQREKLCTDPDVWLCHQCNDCSTHCPRGARPGDVLAAIRSFAVQHYAVPSFLGKVVRDPGYLLLALAIPVAFVLILHYIHHGGFLWVPKHEIHYSEFFPHLWLNLSFGGLFTLVLILAAMGVMSFWKDMKKHRPGATKVGLIPAMIDTFIELAVHGKFRQCGTAKNRSWTHILIFYGFAGLFIVTGIVVIMLLIAPDSYPINTLSHPLKIAGNLTGIMLVVGCTLAVYNRLTDPDVAGTSSYFDWFFLLVLFVVGLSGFGAQFARFREMTTLAYPIYFVHLVFVFALLMYLPYTKFAHMLFRFTALTYAKTIGLEAGDAAAVTAHAEAAAEAKEEDEEEEKKDDDSDDEKEEESEEEKSD
jgi:quinone-modifying oxidoreductase subunit QmoC